MTHLVAIATATPKHAWRTADLIESLKDKLSKELIQTIDSMGVSQRYSVMDNYPEFLRGAPAALTGSTTSLSVDATRRCLQQWGGDPSRVGLLIAATNTPDQMLPCMASEIMARTCDLLERSVRTVSMQAQGCSVLLKSIEVAQWYVAANPRKLAVVVMSEGHTPLVAPLRRDAYHGFKDLLRLRRAGRLDPTAFEQATLDTTFVIQAMLFGDGAVALLIGNDGAKPAFGPIAHLTNDVPDDVHLLTMTANSDHEMLQGRAQYFMKAAVPNRGSYYARHTVEQVFQHPQSPVTNATQVDEFLIHTGSKKILDNVCSQFQLDPRADKVRSSYDVLARYGNLSSASTGFMLAQKGGGGGRTMIVGFGVGFSASAGLLQSGSALGV